MNRMEKAAAGLMDRAGVCRLPVDVDRLARRQGYRLSPYSQSRDLLRRCGMEPLARQYDGFTLQWEGVFHILYRDGLEAARRRRVIAHEIGHILLHLDPEAETYLDRPDTRAASEICEKEADRFALYLLAPLPALDACHVQDAEEIEQLTGCSPDDARQLLYALRDYRQAQEGWCAERRLRRNFSWFALCRDTERHRGMLLAFCSFFVCLLFALGVLLKATAVRSSQLTAMTQPGVSTLEQDPPHSGTVFVTESGEKYHGADCQYIAGRDGLSAMTAEEAEDWGYTPCAVCCDHN